MSVQDVYEPRNILITGGAGFIASHVAIRLTKLYPNYKVQMVVNTSAQCLFAVSCC